MAYIEQNFTPTGDHIEDCIVRALACTFEDEIDYFDILSDLAYTGIIAKRDYRFEGVFKDLLLNHEGKYDMIRLVPHERLTVNKWADLTSELPFHVKHFVLVNEHAVPIKLGNYYDTFDSGRRVVKSVYIRAHDLSDFNRLLDAQEIDYHISWKKEE